MPDDTRCTLAHPDRPHPAAGGLAVCTLHLDHIRDQLTTIAALRAALPDLLPPGRTGQSAGSHDRHTIPANPSMLVATDPRSCRTDHGAWNTDATLCDWATALVTMRWGQARRIILDPATAIRTIGVHLDWAATRPDTIRALRDDLAALIGPLRTLTGDRPDAVTVGPCDCGGNMIAATHHHNNWTPDQPWHRRLTITVICTRCDDTWTEHDLIHYARVNEVWLDTTLVSSLLDIPVRTLQHWAKTGQIRRHKWGIISYTDAATRSQQ